MPRFSGTLYGASERPVARSGTAESGIQVRLTGVDGSSIVVSLHRDRDEPSRDRVMIAKVIDGANHYLYRGPLGPEPEADALLQLARVSDNPTVREAYENLVTIAKLAHGEDLAFDA